MTKNSSSKRAVDQIRCDLSPYGIDLSYTAARRIYDKTGPGPDRVKRAFGIGLIDHVVATTGTPEQQAARGVKPLPVPPKSNSIATIGVDAEGDVVGFDGWDGKHILVFGRDGRLSRNQADRLAAEASLGAQLVIISANHKMAGLKSIADRYASGLEDSLQLLTEVYEQIETAAQNPSDSGEKRIVLMIEGLEVYLRPEQYHHRFLPSDAARRPDARQQMTQRNLLRAQCAELLFAIDHSYGRRVMIIATADPDQMYVPMTDMRWRQFWRLAARLLVGDFTAEDFTWILRRPIPVDEQEEQSLSLTEGVALYETPRIPVRPVSVL